MSALTNYDKWNHVGDDEDAEDAAAAPRRPVVTRLGGQEGSSVTIGGGGWSVAPAAAATAPRAVTSALPAPAPRAVTAAPASAAPSSKRGGVDYSKWDNFDDSSDEGEPNRYIEDDVHREREAEWKAEAAAAPAAPPLPPREPDLDATADGGAGRRDGRTVVAWSQTADEVVARFAANADARGADCAVAVTFDEASGRCAVSVEAPGLEIRGALSHDVWCAGDGRATFRHAATDDDAADLAALDWALEPSRAPLPPGKCLRLTLRKRALAQGVVTWWATLFRNDGSAPVEETPLDTAALSARAKRRGAAPATFKDVWDGAHAAFLDKVRDRPPPVEIDG